MRGHGSFTVQFGQMLQLYMPNTCCIIAVRFFAHTYWTTHMRITQKTRVLYCTFLLYYSHVLYNTTLHFTSLYYSTLYHTSSHYITPHSTTPHYIRTCSIWLCSGSGSVEGRYAVLVSTCWPHCDGHEEGIVGGKGYGPRRPREIVLQHPRKKKSWWN